MRSPASRALAELDAYDRDVYRAGAGRDVSVALQLARPLAELRELAVAMTEALTQS